MTPEITWTHADPDTIEASYRGELWVLLKSSRRTARRPAGWYLHATEGGRALADAGRFISGKAEVAKLHATDAILSGHVRELKAALDRTDQLEVDTRKRVAEALAALRRASFTEADELLGDLLESLGGAP